MIPLRQFQDKTIALFGLGKSGQAAALALQAGGATVWAWDDSPATREDAATEGIPLVDLYSCDWSKPTRFVLSPGIPHEKPQPHPLAARARAAGCEIVGDIELLAQADMSARFLSITGTNGKSTTTALVGHILAASGRAVQVGGNIGTPVLALESLDAEGFYVLEISSYQLETTFSLRSEAAVLLNITPDHLERHGGMAGYIAAKRRIFEGMPSPKAVIVGTDDAICQDIYNELKAAGRPVIGISGQQEVPGGIYVSDGMLYDDSNGSRRLVLDLTGLARLPGHHNWQNAAAAYAACKTAGLAPEAIAAGLTSFPGLPHRQELLTVIDGIAFINDSKATNPDAAAKALACYKRIYWIAGGQAKDKDFTALLPHLHHVARGFLIGEAKSLLADALAGRVETRCCDGLSAAVSQAHEDAKAAIAESPRPTPVVLLSPACASFDSYRNFEVRGDAFRDLVAALPGGRGRPELLSDLLEGVS